ncbi:MAG: hypothetical protein LR008_02830 [Candidatus Pacebacteria bacterium]|nr:hypothetical protein [Candidatus Paceibacterota bacterium]
MNLLRECVDYLKDNPEGYWFKRKMYGIGWIPATKKGWLVLVVYIAFVFGVIFFGPVSETGMPIMIAGPLAGATILFLIVVWRTGESLKWQWGGKNTLED